MTCACCALCCGGRGGAGWTRIVGGVQEEGTVNRTVQESVDCGAV